MPTKMMGTDYAVPSMASSGYELPSLTVLDRKIVYIIKLLYLSQKKNTDFLHNHIHLACYIGLFACVTISFKHCVRSSRIVNYINMTSSGYELIKGVLILTERRMTSSGHKGNHVYSARGCYYFYFCILVPYTEEITNQVFTPWVFEKCTLITRPNRIITHCYALYCVLLTFNYIIPVSFESHINYSTLLYLELAWAE